MISSLARRSVLRAAVAASARHGPGYPVAASIVQNSDAGVSCQHRLLSTSPDYVDYDEWQANDAAAASIALHTPYVGKGAADGASAASHPDEGPRTSVLMELGDRVGALHDVLRFL